MSMCTIYFIKCTKNEFGYGACGIIKEKCNDTLPFCKFFTQCPHYDRMNYKCCHIERSTDICSKEDCSLPDICNFDEIDALY
jgi:hypothetical protein